MCCEDYGKFLEEMVFIVFDGVVLFVCFIVSYLCMYGIILLYVKLLIMFFIVIYIKKIYLGMVCYN